MSDTQEGSRQCFHCDAQFNSDETFLHHIYNVDCGSDSKGSGFPETAPKQPPKPPTQGPDLVQFPDDESPLKSQISTPESIHRCALCDTRFVTSEELYAHTLSTAHRDKVSKMSNIYAMNANKKKPTAMTTGFQQPAFCEDCQVPLPSEMSREIHESGKKHLSMVAQNKLHAENSSKTVYSSPPPPPPQRSMGITEPNSTTGTATAATTDSCDKLERHRFFCELCQLDLPTREDAAEHLITLQHKKNMAAASAQIPATAAGDQHPSLPTITPPLVALSEDCNELNSLLRRMCFTQLLCLIHGIDSKTKGMGEVATRLSVTTTGGERRSIGGVDESELLGLFRAICREELSRMFPLGADLTSVINCSRNGASSLTQ